MRANLDHQLSLTRSTLRRRRAGGIDRGGRDACGCGQRRPHGEGREGAAESGLALVYSLRGRPGGCCCAGIHVHCRAGSRFVFSCKVHTCKSMRSRFHLVVCTRGYNLFQRSSHICLDQMGHTAHSSQGDRPLLHLQSRGGRQSKKGLGEIVCPYLTSFSCKACHYAVSKLSAKACPITMRSATCPHVSTFTSFDHGR